MRAGRPSYCICLRTERAPAVSGNPWGPNEEAELQFRWAGSGVEALEKDQCDKGTLPYVLLFRHAVFKQRLAMASQTTLEML